MNEDLLVTLSRAREQRWGTVVGVGSDGKSPGIVNQSHELFERWSNCPLPQLLTGPRSLVSDRMPRFSRWPTVVGMAERSNARS